MATLKGDGKAILTIFIGVIIAATLIASIATTVTGDTTTISRNNQTVTVPTVNTTLALDGRELLSQISIENSTDGAAVPGMTLQTAEGSNGLLTVELTVNDTAAAFAATSVNLTYTANPDGYIGGNSRSIYLLVTLFGALAILVFIVVTLLKPGASLEKLMRK